MKELIEMTAANLNRCLSTLPCGATIERTPELITAHDDGVLVIEARPLGGWWEVVTPKGYLCKA